MTDDPNPNTEHLIEQAHLAILRHSPGEAHSLLDQVLLSDPTNADANRLLDQLHRSSTPMAPQGPPVFMPQGRPDALGIPQGPRPAFFAPWNWRTMDPTPGWVQALIVLACIAVGIAVTYIPFRGNDLGFGGHLGVGTLLGLFVRFMPRKRRSWWSDFLD